MMMMIMIATYHHHHHYVQFLFASTRVYISEWVCETAKCVFFYSQIFSEKLIKIPSLYARTHTRLSLSVCLSLYVCIQLCEFVLLMTDFCLLVLDIYL